MLHPWYVNPHLAPTSTAFCLGGKERRLIDYIFKSFSDGVDETEEIRSLLDDHKVRTTRRPEPQHLQIQSIGSFVSCVAARIAFRWTQTAGGSAQKY